MSVVLINPGKADEAYWVSAARAMAAAAQALGVQFENRYTERQHPRALQVARELAALPAAKRPDYVVFSNDYGTGPEVLRILDAAGIKTFMAFSAIYDAQDRAQVGRPRERHSHWLGSLEPQAEDAGYLTARGLIAAGRAAGAAARGSDGRLHLLALAGDRSTPTSVRRDLGMRRAVAEAGDVVVDQQVYGGWAREKAAEQAEWLYARHPQAKLVWAANDLMAFGAMAALEARGGEPGRTMWFSAVNTSSEALRAIETGRLAALTGGHFIVGAFALVMLYDHHQGRDFADLGLEQSHPTFIAFTPALAARFEQRFGAGDFSRIDWRSLSRVANPKRTRYDFRFGPLLD